MTQRRRAVRIGFWTVLLFLITLTAWAASGHGSDGNAKLFPPPLDSYGDAGMTGIIPILIHRAKTVPFNLVASIVFALAIIHTFLTSRFLSVAHRWEREHHNRIAQGDADRHSVHIGAELFHFLGEIEVVFGLWAGLTTAAIFFFYDWATLVGYISGTVNFTEPIFVVVIMTLASTRPILKLAEGIMAWVANRFGGSLRAWWMTILTLGPILGSLITEPAAMTISALLLARKFYDLKPSTALKYATLGLLFVNISVGGTLTNFAAPPVLMVAAPWGWDILFMLSHFGWKAVLGIGVANVVYFAMFRKELLGLEHDFSIVRLKEEISTKFIPRHVLEDEFDRIGTVLEEDAAIREAVDRKSRRIKEAARERLRTKYEAMALAEGYDLALAEEAFEQRFEEVRRRTLRQTIPGLLPESERPEYWDPEWDQRDDPVPAWVVVAHVLFMGWTIANAHYPALFVPGLLLFLGFAQVSMPYQNRIDLKPPLLVGFFLGGLVIHGGVQGWWIAPVLSSLSELPLMLGATILTAFNDNAAITYLATLVPNFSDPLKYAVVSGAVAGGGLTIIANAPNPAGQAILKQYFDDGISPIQLLVWALAPTVVMLLGFYLLR